MRRNNVGSRERRQPVRVFERDPDLLRGLSDRDAKQARKCAVASTVKLPRGTWRPRSRSPQEVCGHLGLLVLDGHLSRNTVVAADPCAELLGTGDLLRPWQDESSFASFPWKSS